MIKSDTIASIATAAGQGAIGIVRVSGDDAMGVVSRVFVCGERDRPIVPRKMCYGEIVADGGEVIDEVMVCVFNAPNSFTTEDTAEIYAHGGMYVLSEVLGAVIKAGARLAEPGEFTKRAFYNGRIDLSQAEAVMDIINAKSTAQRRVAVRQLGGGLCERIEAVRDRILQWLAHIELSIDYPEHEEEARNAAQILAESGAVVDDLERLLRTADTGKIIREGVRTAIVGRPNVGKSTLLNAILHENRAIVHETAGTTRDVLTESVRIGDISLVIMDTAGLRQTSDPIEKIGIEKTYEAAEDAELILFLADAVTGLTADDEEIIKTLPATAKVIVLLNKSDLISCDSAPHLKISAKTGEGIDELFSMIQEMFIAGGIGEGANADIITNKRHALLLEQALRHVQTAVGELSAQVPEDLVSVSLRAAYIALGEILGVEIGDDIVDRIFAEFCLGK